jgi:hypothetical protein
LDALCDLKCAYPTFTKHMSYNKDWGSNSLNCMIEKNFF